MDVILHQVPLEEPHFIDDSQSGERCGHASAKRLQAQTYGRSQYLGEFLEVGYAGIALSGAGVTVIMSVIRRLLSS